MARRVAAGLLRSGRAARLCGPCRHRHHTGGARAAVAPIIGRSQREERLAAVLHRSMAERSIDREHYRLVPRPAPLRHGAARRLRPRLRTHPRLRLRPRERPRRNPLPANARQRAVLILPWRSRSAGARPRLYAEGLDRWRDTDQSSQGPTKPFKSTAS
jgi:hypothetical protein